MKLPNRCRTGTRRPTMPTPNCLSASPGRGRATGVGAWPFAASGAARPVAGSRSHPAGNLQRELSRTGRRWWPGRLAGLRRRSVWPSWVTTCEGDFSARAAHGLCRVRLGIDGGSRGSHHGLPVTQSMSCRSAYSESTRSFSIRMARTIDDSSAWPMCGR